MDSETTAAPASASAAPSAAPAALSTSPLSRLANKPGSLSADPTDACDVLHRRLASLLGQNTQASDFMHRLQFVEDGIEQLHDSRPDDSLFMLVQMLFDPHCTYSATHALLAALMCRMVGPLAGIDAAALPSLVRAALTMNIGMTKLHDALAQQVAPTSSQQREEIGNHPSRGANILRSIGVSDAAWIALVQDHHESPDGKGYPYGKAELGQDQQLLHMADVFIARISPRASRRGLSPNLAAGNIYLESGDEAKALAATFVKHVGMYPPGSYVRLRSDEVAVVVRRGPQVHTPMVMALVDADGMPLTVPGKRDTRLPPYRVTSPVPPEQVKIRLDRSKLLRRV